MGKILRDMNAEEQAFYDSDAKRHPWLKSITMTDDELRTLLDKYLPDGYSPFLFNPLWNRHYSWVFMAKIKYFLETGEFVLYDEAYLDGQADWILTQIMAGDGADGATIDDVLCGRKKYTFKNKYTQRPFCALDV